MRPLLGNYETNGLNEIPLGMKRKALGTDRNGLGLIWEGR